MAPTRVFSQAMSARIREQEAKEAKERSVAALAAARSEYAADIRRGHGGPSASARFADRIDDLIRDISWSARDLYTVPFAVAALGGYGRRMLCLHSDLDLLIVFQGSIGAAEEQLVKALLHPLWDLRLTVGHQVRELAELEHPETNNPEFLLALLDARMVAGEEPVFHEVVAHAPRAGRDPAPEVLRALLGLIDQRHAGYNRTFYQLEPDVKDAPGGLRDIASARWIKALAGEDWIDGGRFDERRLYEAEDLLIRIRSILHLESGRNTNVLSHPLQERVADVLRFGGVSSQQRVEGLMGEYFRHARAVARVLDWAIQTVQGPRATSQPAVIADGLEQGSDGLRFRDPRQAASDPTIWLRAFDAALERGCALSDLALTLIEQNVERYGPEDFVESAEARDLVKRLFKPRRGLYARLSEMHDCGLLGRIFPEFERIHSRVIRDFYHKYTVDEHTLLTLRNLESLLDPTTPSRGRFCSLLLELHAPELLGLALLFHDVGKWKDDDHAIESTRMAQPMLDRLNITGEARRTIVFLIEHHLEMSRLAFRRDSEDPAVAHQFARLVGTEDMLKMLCLLTFVDIGAVSPDTLTPWKEELLWRLYVDTYNDLTMSYADELIDKDQEAVSALVAARPPDMSDVELVRFLQGLPRRYLPMFDYRHVRLARDIQPDEIHASIEPKADVWELTVVTLDKPFLFSNISGVLSYFGMDILRGQAMTTPVGLVLDVFQFTDHEGFLRHNAIATAEILEKLQDVVSGKIEIAPLLRGKERSVLYRRPQRVAPVVYFDNEHSHKYTVLEIVADDSLGLLHRMSRVISRNRCDVDLVLVSTEGHKAIDVFHITKAGRKLSNADQLELSAHLHRMLEGGYEAD
jgi:[protein-PII] uridylyltransferase